MYNFDETTRTEKLLGGKKTLQNFCDAALNCIHYTELTVSSCAHVVHEYFAGKTFFLSHPGMTVPLLCVRPLFLSSTQPA